VSTKVTVDLGGGPSPLAVMANPPQTDEWSSSPTGWEPNNEAAEQSGLIGMSLYQRFLGMALDETSDVDDGLTAGEAVAVLLLCRRQLQGRDDGSDGSSSIASSLGEELDYDIALLRLARLLGIQVEVQAFDRPQVERSHLEQAIEAHGIRFNDLDS
jgi:hypothetical protein